MATTIITYKDALIALLKQEIDDIQNDASPITDYYLSQSDTYRFDITGDQIRRYLRYKISYRPRLNLKRN